VADASDAFPLDEHEQLDTDTDGIGNKADTDDDGDGVLDADDAFPNDATRSKPDQPQPETPHPEDTKPEKTKPEQTKPEQTKPVVKPIAERFDGFIDPAKPLTCPTPDSLTGSASEWVALRGSSFTGLGKTTTTALTDTSKPVSGAASSPAPRTASRSSTARCRC
jgi:hypothetical protein